MARVARRSAATIAATLLVIAAAIAPAAAADAPYVHRWRIQSEVGGDIGGRSELAVTESAASVDAKAGLFEGAIRYGDRLVVQDPQGGVLVQVSAMELELTGAPAAGGSGMGGLFEGTARLDDYLGLTWEQAVSGTLPDRPTRSATYVVAGRWGAWLAGQTADGELVFESAAIQAKAGAVDTRDASWFNRFGSGREQTFKTTVQGAVVPPSASAAAAAAGRAPRATDYVAVGLAGGTTGAAVAAVPLESALSARALREARPKGATALPAGSVTIDVDISGLALDAKNRATGQQPDSAAGQRAAATWRAAREASAPVSLDSTAAELTRLLGAQKSTAGAPELLAQVEQLAADEVIAPDAADMLSAWLASARALSEPPESVLAATGKAAADVRDTPVPKSGPAADGLLADADSPSAPVASLEVARFARETEGDVSFVRGGQRVIGGAGIVREVLAGADLDEGAPVVRFTSARGARTIAPASWLGHQRDDGVAFWLAGPGGSEAMRDGTLAGWAYTSRMARIVSAARCGQTLAILRAGPPRAALGQ